ncbi:MAG: hypothetical protein JW726_02300 [Anaerolineales bacterium]|nr:hypothetical protein [Anaerolineales bacterium]
MSQVNTIIDAIKQNKHSPTGLAEVISWETLSLTDREELINQVHELWETPHSLKLLLFLHLVNDADPWYRLRILGLAAQHTEVNEESRLDALNELGSLLSTLTPADEAQRTSYLRSQALYACLQAQYMEKVQRPQEATEQYQKAYKIYMDLGLAKSAAAVDRELNKLQSAPATEDSQPIANEVLAPPPQGQEPEADLEAPISTQEEPPSTLDADKKKLERLEGEKRDLEQQISQLQQTICAAMAEQKKGLEYELHILQQNIELAQQEKQYLEAEIKSLTQTRNDYRNAAQVISTLESQTQQIQSELEKAQAELIKTHQENISMKEELAKHREKVLPDWARSMLNEG